MKSRLVDLCLMAMMGTVMVVSKETLAALPLSLIHISEPTRP